MKQVTAVKVEGGYIVTTNDPQNGQRISVHPNFGHGLKLIREFFDEQKQKTDAKDE